METALRAAARFHGHLGPWLVLGLRAGAFAVRKLGGTPFERRATVWCPEAPPCSCFLDGVQLSSGCTLGKANIHHIRAAGSCRAVFARGRRRLALRLRPEVADRLRSGPPRTAPVVAHAARRLYRTPLSRLFIITPV
ncbi:formylmethanofuran dehydrogenase [candidate division WOR-3 bacterium]|nr:formylmethanofuran dehydrogenase [candidate division WOR-3 bacterium]